LYATLKTLEELIGIDVDEQIGSPSIVNARACAWPKPATARSTSARME
jgi:hypothetical protein